MTPDLSIVFPAYNEARRLPASLEKAFEFISSTGRSAEVVVVDDGSSDDMVEVIRAQFGGRPDLRIVSYHPNRGKGWAVKTGVLESKGRLVLMSDADLSTPLTDLPVLERAMDAGADLVIGSRAVAGSQVVVAQKPLRQLGGKVFNRLLRTFLLKGLHDTQCGFKLFNRQKVQPVFEQMTIERFGFDIEMLFLADRQGLKIAEVPVSWYNSEDTKVNFARDSSQMFIDIFRVRLNDMKGVYGPRGER